MIKIEKGEIALEYIFIIFIAVITVFVIVGMLTNWSFGADKYISRILESGEEAVPDIQFVLSNNPDAVLEKHKKLCSEKCESKVLRSNLCYVIADGTYSKIYVLSCENQVMSVNGVKVG